MAFNITDGCPYPFLALKDYPYTGGLQSSRYCQPSPLSLNTICCLPCPVTDWIYEDNFDTVTTVTNWISVGGFICCVFLLLSFICLPVAKTSRHYLTIGLVVGVAFINLSFIIALWAKPKQCFDAITANDMYTSLACAWSGALLLYGGFTAVMWVFNRSLSLFLQICCSRIPGKKSFYAAQIVGWGLPALFVGLSLGVSGVAYRFGNVCHINHNDSIAAFFGPLLAFAGLAAIIQFITLGYVCRVYLRNLWDPNSTSAASSSMRSAPLSLTNPSFQQKSVRATYRRVRKVLGLQWRGIVVVLIVLASATYFAVVFNIFDQLGTVAIRDPVKTLPWITCVIAARGDKKQCLTQASNFSLSETIVAAVLVLLSLMGWWCLLFLGRWSMVTGWWELIKKPFEKNDTFTSLDARRISDPRNYEMLTSPPQSYHMTKSASGALVATAKPQVMSFDTTDSIIKKDFGDDSPTDYFASPELPPAAARKYVGRHGSFSQPLSTRSPSSQRVVFKDEKESQRPSPQQNIINWQTQTYQHSVAEQNNEYTSKDNNPHSTMARSPSTAQERSGSALGRAWPGPTPRQGASPSPIPYRSNSRAGAGSALGIRGPPSEWDPTSTYARR